MPSRASRFLSSAVLLLTSIALLRRGGGHGWRLALLTLLGTLVLPAEIGRMTAEAALLEALLHERPASNRFCRWPVFFLFGVPGE